MPFKYTVACPSFQQSLYFAVTVPYPRSCVQSVPSSLKWANAFQPSLHSLASPTFPEKPWIFQPRGATKSCAVCQFTYSGAPHSTMQEGYALGRMQPLNPERDIYPPHGPMHFHQTRLVKQAGTNQNNNAMHTRESRSCYYRNASQLTILGLLSPNQIPLTNTQVLKRGKHTSSYQLSGYDKPVQCQSPSLVQPS